MSEGIEVSVLAYIWIRTGQRDQWQEAGPEASTFPKYENVSYFMNVKFSAACYFTERRTTNFTDYMASNKKWRL
jgi:hypothetical protein